MECVSSVSSLIINGKPSKRIFPSRGFRQGVHLFPYLFLLVIGVLSRMIHLGVQTNEVAGVKLSKHCAVLSHLLFASLFFAEAKKNSCQKLLSIIQEFCKASGQKVNVDKSNIVFSTNTPADVKHQIVQCLGIKAANSPSNYLRIQSLWGKTKYEAIGYIQDRVLAKVKN